MLTLVDVFSRIAAARQMGRLRKTIVAHATATPITTVPRTVVMSGEAMPKSMGVAPARGPRRNPAAVRTATALLGSGWRVFPATAIMAGRESCAKARWTSAQVLHAKMAQAAATASIRTNAAATRTTRATIAGCTPHLLPRHLNRCLSRPVTRSRHRIQHLPTLTPVRSKQVLGAIRNPKGHGPLLSSKFTPVSLFHLRSGATLSLL